MLATEARGSAFPCQRAGAAPTPYSTILVFLVILFVIATVPIRPYSRTWGLWPSGALALLAVAIFGYLVMS